MKVFLCVLVSISVLYAAECLKTESELDRECPQVCPKIMDPLCAFDGNSSFKYFHNECLMRYNKCRSGRTWTPTHMSLCMHQVDPIILQECLRPCPFIYQPVCASNGQQKEVFGNECIFEMENCFANYKWIQIKGDDCGLED